MHFPMYVCVFVFLIKHCLHEYFLFSSSSGSYFWTAALCVFLTLLCQRPLKNAAMHLACLFCLPGCGSTILNNNTTSTKFFSRCQEALGKTATKQCITSQWFSVSVTETGQKVRSVLNLNINKFVFVCI